MGRISDLKNHGNESDLSALVCFSFGPIDGRELRRE